MSHEPAALITFDDGRISVYENAFPAMQTRGIKATNYVHTLEMGPPSFTTVEQLQEMYAAGWAISSHTHTHLHLDDLTQAEAEYELSTCKDLLDGWGMTRASAHVAYPYGDYDADVFAAMTATGMLTGRTCDINTLTRADVNENELIYKLPIGYVLGTTSLADVKSWLDTCKRHGRTIILLFHSIVESPSDTYDWAASDFVALLDYIQQIGIATPTIDEWYANYKQAYP